jgi:hypothetical protein
MGDAHEIYDALKICNQQHRAEKRAESPKILKRKGIQFESKNNGAHLIVSGRSVVVDFWPGTGKWVARKTGQKGYGVIALLKLEGIFP